MPGEHVLLRQVEVPPGDGWKRPATHAVHSLAPRAGAEWPGEHDEHAGWPVWLTNLPLAHGSHVARAMKVLPRGANDPAAQGAPRQDVSPGLG